MHKPESLYKHPKVHEKEIERNARNIRLGYYKEKRITYTVHCIVPKKSYNTREKIWRIVIDYMRLKEITICDKCPIPNIDEKYLN